MKITAIRTFLMQCAPPQAGGWSARNWLFAHILIGIPAEFELDPRLVRGL